MRNIFLKTPLKLFLACIFTQLNPAINFTNQNSTLAITGSTSQLILGAPLTVSGTLKIPNYTAGTSITQTATTNTITYSSDATTIFNGTSLQAVGSYSPATSSSTTLTGSQTQTFTSGPVTQSLTISGTGNTLYGSPIFQQPITISNSSSSVDVGITSKLTSNIVMNGGTLNLTQDLFLKDNVFLVGNGTVNCNGFSFVLPISSTAWTGNLTFNSGNDITITARTSLTGTWSFTGATNNLKGTGVILDLTGGGVLSIANGTSLYANGVHIKGLGVTGGGSITFGNSSSKMYLTNCTLELSGNYTQTQGQMIVEGTTCKIIADFNDKYIISGATSIFQVNGQVLEYINVGSLSNNPLTTTSGGTISLINNGSIRSAMVPGAKANFEANVATGTGTNFSDSPVFLGAGATLTFVNATPASAKSMTFDANNNTVTFGDDAATCFILQNNVNLTIQNVKFYNFDPAKISLGTSASITYGDNVIFEFAKNVSLTANALTLTGNTTIQGANPGITLSVAGQGITLTGANKVLTVRGLKLRNNTYNSIKINTTTAKLSLQAMDFYMTATGFTFDTGSIEFKDDVNFIGASETTPEAVTTFSFTTTGLATILSGSKLKLHPDTKFLYTPNTASDGGVASVQKRHFKTTDPSSVLQLQHAYIDAGSTGMALDYGKFIIEELANITTTTTTGKEFELGSSVNTTILTSGVLNVSGLIKYVTTTYP